MTIELDGPIIPEFSRGDRFRKARELTGLDQGAFAEEIGASRTTICNVELEHRTPSRLTVNAWAMRTRVPKQWLETGVVPAGDDGGDSPTLPRLDSNQQPADEPFALVRALRLAA